MLDSSVGLQTSLGGFGTESARMRQIGTKDCLDELHAHGVVQKRGQTCRRRLHGSFVALPRC
jgi:hypothetical protein